MTTPAGAHSHPELAQEIADKVKAGLAESKQEGQAVTEKAAQQSADAQAAAYDAQQDIAALREEMKAGFADLQKQAPAAPEPPAEPPVALPAEPLPAPPAPAAPADGGEGQGDGGEGGDPPPPPAETKNTPAKKKRRSAYWGM